MKRYGHYHQDVRKPFAPCERYRPIPAGCATCAVSIEGPPCPELVQAFTEGAEEMELILSMGETRTGAEHSAADDARWSATGAYPIEAADRA